MSHTTLGGDQEKGRRPGALFIAALALFVLYAWPASAIEFFRDNDKLQLNIDTTLSIGTSVRVQERDNRLIFKGNDPTDRTNGILSTPANGLPNFTNSDDGNLNYNKGDIYSANVRSTFDVEIDYRLDHSVFKNVGGFFRANAFYDVVGNCGHCTQRTNLVYDTRRTDSVIDGGVVGTQWIFLDMYADTTMDVFGRYMNLRFGNQVLSWGESLFTPGGISATNAIDVAKIRVPGSELRDALVPAPIIRVSSDIISTLSIEAYYQFYWNRTQLDPTGSYFSTSDLMGRGAEGLFFGNDPGSGCDPTPAGFPPFPPEPNGCPGYVQGISQSGDAEPSSQGQTGVALRYFWDRILTEFAVYYIRYHSKQPSLGATATLIPNPGPGPPAFPVPTSYFRDYADGINLLGFSVSTELFGASVGGELSYRDNDATPITTSIADASTAAAIDGTIGATHFASGYVREKKIQAQAFMIANFSSSTRLGVGPVVGLLRAQSISFTTELAVASYPDFDPSIAYAAAPTKTADQTSFGYQFLLRGSYENPLGVPITVVPTLGWLHDAVGNTPGQSPFIEGRMALTAGLEFDYLSTWGLQLRYANFWGEGISNISHDRDFFSGSVSYSF